MTVEFESISIKDEAIDLNQLCIQHPAATFFVRVAGDSMIGAGIFDGDILIVDRALDARCGDVVVASVDGEFTVKRYQASPYLALIPENPDFPEIKLTNYQDVDLFGVVVHSIRKLR